jgi:hypothetical protein
VRVKLLGAAAANAAAATTGATDATHG